MFTGIIESLGIVKRIVKEKDNMHITVESNFTSELKIDQSVAHNGVCLTVVDIVDDQYTVTAIDETLKRTNIGGLSEGDEVNLERCTKVGDRLDGHIVQGHVDQTAELIDVQDQNGSWEFNFRFNNKPLHTLIDKGSITINGVSLTISALSDNEIGVSIIPYTFENTNFGHLKPGDRVNIEFDVIGKYVEKLYRN